MDDSPPQSSHAVASRSSQAAVPIFTWVRRKQHYVSLDVRSAGSDDSLIAADLVPPVGACQSRGLRSGVALPLEDHHTLENEILDGLTFLVTSGKAAGQTYTIQQTLALTRLFLRFFLMMHVPKKHVVVCDICLAWPWLFSVYWALCFRSSVVVENFLEVMLVWFSVTWDANSFSRIEHAVGRKMLFGQPHLGRHKIHVFASGTQSTRTQSQISLTSHESTPLSSQVVTVPQIQTVQMNEPVNFALQVLKNYVEASTTAIPDGRSSALEALDQIRAYLTATLVKHDTWILVLDHLDHWKGYRPCRQRKNNIVNGSRRSQFKVQSVSFALVSGGGSSDALSKTNTRGHCWVGFTTKGWRHLFSTLPLGQCALVWSIAGQRRSARYHQRATGHIWNIFWNFGGQWEPHFSSIICFTSTCSCIWEP